MGVGFFFGSYTENIKLVSYDKYCLEGQKKWLVSYGGKKVFMRNKTKRMVVIVVPYTVKKVRVEQTGILLPELVTFLANKQSVMSAILN